MYETCSSDICPSIGVLITAGAIAFTRIPVPATSLPIAFVRPITAAFDDEYAPAIGLPSFPAIEATLTMRP